MIEIPEGLKITIAIVTIVYGRYTVAIVSNIDFMGDIIAIVYIVWQLATGWPHRKIQSGQNLIYPEDWPKEMNHPRSSTTIHPRNLVEYIDYIIHQADIGSLLDDSLNFHTSDKQKMLSSALFLGSLGHENSHPYCKTGSEVSQ